MQLNHDDQQLFDQLLNFNQEICRRMPMWNQGMGGNVSVKLGSALMAIKPSGLRLDALTDLSSFAFINYEEFDSFLHHLTMSPIGLSEKEYAYNQEIEKAKLKRWSERRSSMEAGFHASLQARYVLHFHHLNSMALAEIVTDIQHTDFFSKWGNYFRLAPYKRPGWELSEYFVKGQVKNKLIVMKNHGAILQIDDLQDWEVFLQFDAALTKLLEGRTPVDKWSRGQQILLATSASGDFHGPFKYYYPDVAIFEAKLKKHLDSNSESLFHLPAGKAVPRDLFENWQGMNYLNCLCPEMSGLTLADAESLRSMPSEMARVEQMLELAKAALAAAKPGRR